MIHTDDDIYDKALSTNMLKSLRVSGFRQIICFCGLGSEKNLKEKGRML